VDALCLTQNEGERTTSAAASAASHERRMATFPPPPPVATFPPATSTMNRSSLELKSAWNFFLALLSLLYAAHNVVMLILNTRDHNDDDCGDPEDLTIARCGSATSDVIFHRFEFWATFCFALVTAFSLMYTPKAAVNIYARPLLLKLVLMIEICFAAVPAALVTVNLAKYELFCHEIEYVNELTVSFVDIILLASLLRLPDDEDDDQDDQDDLEWGNHHQRYSTATMRGRLSVASSTTSSDRHDTVDSIEEEEEEDDDDTSDKKIIPSSSPGENNNNGGAVVRKDASSERTRFAVDFVPMEESVRHTQKQQTQQQQEQQQNNARIVPMVAMGVAAIQLVIYNSFPWYAHAEQTAHYFEFTFGILSSFVTFWFCMDNRFEAEKEIMLILYGNHRDCLNCTARKQSFAPMNDRRNTVAASIRRKLARTFSISQPQPNRRVSTSFELTGASSNNNAPSSKRLSAHIAAAAGPSYDACG